MNLHVEYQKGDLRNAKRLFFSRSTWAKVCQWISIILAGVVLILAIINTVLVFQGSGYGHIYGGFVIILSGISLTLSSFLNRVRYLPSSIDFEVTEEGVTQKTWNKTVQKKWSEFSNYAYDDKMLVMLYPSYYYMALPKHSMNVNEWNELLTMVKTNIKVS